jgi:hypothetical protein
MLGAKNAHLCGHELSEMLLRGWDVASLANAPVKGNDWPRRNLTPGTPLRKDPDSQRKATA